MELERCYSVLAVSSSLKFNEALGRLLPGSRYGPVTVVRDGAAARRAMLEQSRDLVIVSTPLPDEFGIRLALDLCESSSAAVLLLVRGEDLPEVAARVEPRGIATLAKPTSAQAFDQALRILRLCRDRLRGMEKKTASIQERMMDIRLIDRAKWILIEELKMTEPEAHRYIEKQAMDRCITKRAVAEQILSTYP